LWSQDESYLNFGEFIMGCELKGLEKIYRFQCPKCVGWDYAYINNFPEDENDKTCLDCYCWITITRNIK